MARSTCCYSKAVSTSGNSEEDSFGLWISVFSHTSPAVRPTPKAFSLRINLAQTMQNTGAWRSLLRTAFGAARRPKAHGIPWMRLGLSMEPGEKMHVEFLMKDKNILRQIAKVLVIRSPGRHSNFGSLPGKEQTRKTDSPFLKTQGWTDLGGSESAANCLSQVDEERPAKLLAATKRRRI